MADRGDGGGGGAGSASRFAAVSSRARPRFAPAPRRPPRDGRRRARAVSSMARSRAARPAGSSSSSSSARATASRSSISRSNANRTIPRSSAGRASPRDVHARTDRFATTDCGDSASELAGAAVSRLRAAPSPRAFADWRSRATRSGECAAHGTHLGDYPPDAWHQVPPPIPTTQLALHARVARLEALARRRGRALAVTAVALLALGVAAAFGVVGVHRQLASCRARLVESRQGHSALARAGGDAAPARHVLTPWRTRSTAM